MLCVRNEWRQGRTAILTQVLPLDHSRTSFTSWLGLLNQESLRTQSPLSATSSHFGILSPTASNRRGTWLHYCLTPACFCCSSTQVHLLIDSLVKGQYITIIPFLFFKIPHVDIFFTSLSIPLTHTSYK